MKSAIDHRPSAIDHRPSIIGHDNLNYYIIKRISIEQGFSLSNSTVEAIYQDQKGFIWIGTRDGLNRFDGYQMVVYRYDANNPASLSDNYIRYIYEDKSHNLWIGTINGLNRFDRQRTVSRGINMYPATRKASAITWSPAFMKTERHLWVSTYGGGINLFLPGKNNLHSFPA
jgi:ligand-binding sensor domain-containing protein